MRWFSIWTCGIAVAAFAETLAAFTLDAWLVRLDAAKVVSLEDALGTLPIEYKTNYILVHRSLSAQSASPQKPRVLMFGNDGQFVASFNSEAPSVEIIQ